MDRATTLHGHPAMVHTKIIRNFPVVGHFEYGDFRLFSNLQRSHGFFPPHPITLIDVFHRKALPRTHAQLPASQRDTPLPAHHLPLPPPPPPRHPPDSA